MLPNCHLLRHIAVDTETDLYQAVLAAHVPIVETDTEHHLVYVDLEISNWALTQPLQ